MEATRKNKKELKVIKHHKKLNTGINSGRQEIKPHTEPNNPRSNIGD